MTSSSSNGATRRREMEMVFFDIETNIFPIEVIEFGAIIVDKFSYVELERIHTMIHPESKSISAKATAIHGITYEHLKQAPTFAAVANKIHDALDGRIWVGHNIQSFDTPHLQKAFTANGVTPPTPHAVLDTLPLVRRIFGKRAGDCKMATLGNYFNLGTEKHRAVEDSEMTLQALKCIALHNLLEREMPATFPKFVEPGAKEIVVQNGASSTSSTTFPVTMDALTTQLASATISSGSDEIKKPKVKKEKKPSGTHSPSFVGPSLLPTSSSTALPTPAVATVSPADDGWQVAHSKKALKHAEAEAAAESQRLAAKKAAKKAAKQFNKQANRQPERERAASTGTNQTQSTPASQGTNSQESTNSSSGSTWSKLVKGTPNSQPSISRATSDQSAHASTLSATATTFKPTTAAPVPVTAAASSSTSPPLVNGSSSTWSSPPAITSQPPSTTNSLATTAAASSTTKSTTPAPLSPSDHAALLSTIDHYVSNPTLRCALAYGGGSNPGRVHTCTNFAWQKRPAIFKAIIVNNRHGNEFVHFSTNKCLSFTRID